MMALQPAEVLGTLMASGLTVSLMPDSGLKVSPSSALTDELRSLIRAHKAALVDCLKRQAELEREMVDERAAILEFDAGLERDLAERMAKSHTSYLLHHWGCARCVSAGQGRGHRCEVGARLWAAYQDIEAAADAAPKTNTRRNSK